MAKELDCGLEANEFEFQSRYYVHFRNDTLGKVNVKIVSLLFFYKDGFGVK